MIYQQAGTTLKYTQQDNKTSEGAVVHSDDEK